MDIVGDIFELLGAMPDGTVDDVYCFSMEPKWFLEIRPQPTIAKRILRFRIMGYMMGPGFKDATS